MKRVLLAFLALTGAAEARTPSALVAMIPGSGFNGAEPELVERMSIGERAWRRAGYRTVPIGYRPGKAGLRDVLVSVRRLYLRNPGMPLCLYGESSGGAWALQAANRTGVVDCVVVVSGVTDQETLARSPHRLARHLGTKVWRRYFGPPADDEYFEPYDVWKRNPIEVPTLLLYAKSDRIVPPQQGELMATVIPGAELKVLDRGKRRFAHDRVDSAQFVFARREAMGLVGRQTTSP